MTDELNIFTLLNLTQVSGSGTGFFIDIQYFRSELPDASVTDEVDLISLSFVTLRSGVFASQLGKGAIASTGAWEPIDARGSCLITLPSNDSEATGFLSTPVTGESDIVSSTRSVSGTGYWAEGGGHIGLALSGCLPGHSLLSRGNRIAIHTHPDSLRMWVPCAEGASAYLKEYRDSVLLAIGGDAKWGSPAIELLPNLVLNADFEVDASGWAAFGTSVVSQTTVIAHSGSGAGLCNGRAGVGDGVEYALDVSKFVSGDDVIGSIWCRTSVSGETVNLKLRKVDGSGTSVITLDSGVGYPTKWVQLIGRSTLTISGSLSSLSLLIDGPSAGVDIYVDDARVSDLTLYGFVDLSDYLSLLRAIDSVWVSVSFKRWNLLTPRTSTVVLRNVTDYVTRFEIGFDGTQGLYCGATRISTDTPVYVYTGEHWDDDTWHRLTCYVDWQNSTVQIWVDGDLVADQTGVFSTTGVTEDQNASSFMLGDTSIDSFDGAITDFQIYVNDKPTKLEVLDDCGNFIDGSTSPLTHTNTFYEGHAFWVPCISKMQHPIDAISMDAIQAFVGWDGDSIDLNVPPTSIGAPENPGFETGDITGWSVEGAATLAASAAQVRTGSYSGYCSTRAASSDGAAVDLDEFEVRLGTTLSISAYLRLETGTQDMVCSVKLDSTWYTLNSVECDSSGWTLFESVFTIPVSFSTARVIWHGPSGVNFYIDDAAIQVTTARFLNLPLALTQLSDAFTLICSFKRPVGGGTVELFRVDDRCRVYIDSSNGVTIGGKRLDGDTYSETSAGALFTYDDDLWHRMVAVWSWRDAKTFLWVDDVLVASDITFQTAGRTSDTAASVSSIGYWLENWFDGAVADIQAYVDRPYTATHVGRDWSHFLLGLLTGLSGAEEQNVVISGKAQIERDAVISGKPHLTIVRRGCLYCVASKNLERSGAIHSKWDIDRNVVTRAKTWFDANVAVRCENFVHPVIDLETLKFRYSSVYPTPASQFPLSIVYGDWTVDGVYVELFQIDVQNRLWILSDRPVLEINKLYRSSDGITFSEINSGYTAYPNYRDNTGRNISVVHFTSEQSGNRIFASCKGVHNNGSLLVNPADIFLDVMENMQGYSIEFIDLVAISRLHAECSFNDIEGRVVLKDPKQTVKNFISILALNTNSVHTTNDGAHGLIRRGGVL